MTSEHEQHLDPIEAEADRLGDQKHRGGAGYRTLDARFLAAMDEIGLLGMQKYADNSFEAQRERGELKRCARTESDEIGEHIKSHYEAYLQDVRHDHFRTDRHQLAAVAFNAMMEFVYATECDSGGAQARENVAAPLSVSADNS